MGFLCWKMISLQIGIIFSLIILEVIKFSRKCKKKLKHIHALQILLSITYCILYSNVMAHLNISILLSIPIAYIAYLLSLFIVGTKFTKNNLLLRKTRLSPSFHVCLKKELKKNIFYASLEEFLYRGALQHLLLIYTNVILATILTVIYFTAIHYRPNIPIVHIIDILVFAIIVSICYALTMNIYIVLFVHVLRNSFVILQKYISYQQTYNRFAHIQNTIKNWG